MSAFQVVNPATEEPVGSFADSGRSDVADAVASCRAGQPDWAVPGAEWRAGFLIDLAKVLQARSLELALTITREMGKPLAEARYEVDKCVAQALLLAREGPAWLAEENIEGTRSRVVAEPRGVAAVIVPWNFPLWQPVRSVLPALLAGNTCVLKPAPQGTLTALALRRAFEEAQLPRGVLRLVLGGPAAGEALVQAPVDVVAFTGSVAAGKRVAQAASAELKPVILELGGSDPFLVLDDADLDLAVRLGVEGRFRNAGQICISVKRFLVAEPLAEDFRDRFVEATRRLRVGDPLEPGTNMGPLVSAAQRDRLHAQVEASAAAGARVLCGGAPLPQKGFYYAPTVLDLVRPGMPVWDEETFGPVAPIVAVRGDREAIQLANATSFGLGASVISRDRARADRVARQLQVGLVALNDIVHSDMRVPFGGTKQSGLGRELGREGLRAFANLKAVTGDRGGPGERSA